MSEKKIVKPIALAVGAVFVASFAISGVVNADTIENPFSISTLSAGYMLDGGEGSCGGDKEDKDAEGNCGEGSCGADKDAEGSCGEGSCGGNKNENKDAEGSCGEGSCGDDKNSEKE